MNRNLTIARFTSKTDNLAKHETISWEALCDLLTTHTERTSKDGPLWSPTRYGESQRRLLANVEAVSCLVLDFDSGLVPDVERWEAWEYVLHTTYQHALAGPRWRAVFPFAEEVLAPDWPVTWERLVGQFGGNSTDRSCKDASRMYYLPACAPGGERTAIRHRGRWIYPRRPTIPYLVQEAKKNLHLGRNEAGMLLAVQLRDNRYTQVEAEAADWHREVVREKVLPNGRVDVYEEGEWLATVRKVYARAPRDPWRIGGGHGGSDWQNGTAENSSNGTGPAPDAEPAATTNREPQQGDPQTFDDGLGLNDKGNAWRLVNQFGENLRFCKNLGWLVWDGHRWELDECQRISEYAKAVVSSLYREAAKIEKEDHRKLLAGWAVRSGMKERILAMAKLAESDPAIVVRATELDADPWLLNVANGTLDLRTGRLREPSRRDMITRQIFTVYDAYAACPVFEEFMLQIMDGRPELVDYLQRWVGYCLTGDTREQSLLFLYGMGANGKSTFLGVLQQLIGDYAKQAAPGLLLSRGQDRHPTEIAELRGARLVVSVEVGEGKKLAEELVKQMTGGDKMKGRFMHRDFIEFVAEFKLLLAANHKPVIKGTDYAIWRRIPLVPFDVTFTDDGPNFKDVQLAEKLRAELPGILAWGVRGCQEWRGRGLAPPLVVVEASKAYRNEMDVFGDFLADECDEHRDYAVSAGSLYEAYKQWAGRTGERPMSQKMLANKLKEKGFSPDRHGGDQLRIWKGLQLRQGPPMDGRMGADG